MYKEVETINKCTKRGAVVVKKKNWMGTCRGLSQQIRYGAAEAHEHDREDVLDQGSGQRGQRLRGPRRGSDVFVGFALGRRGVDVREHVQVLVFVGDRRGIPRRRPRRFPGRIPGIIHGIVVRGAVAQIVSTGNRVAGIPGVPNQRIVRIAVTVCDGVAQGGSLGDVTGGGGGVQRGVAGAAAGALQQGLLGVVGHVHFLALVRVLQLADPHLEVEGLLLDRWGCEAGGWRWRCGCVFSGGGAVPAGRGRGCHAVVVAVQHWKVAPQLAGVFHGLQRKRSSIKRRVASW